MEGDGYKKDGQSEEGRDRGRKRAMERDKVRGREREGGSGKFTAVLLNFLILTTMIIAGTLALAYVKYGWLWIKGRRLIRVGRVAGRQKIATPAGSRGGAKRPGSLMWRIKKQE
jgi:hypothetical protein